MTKPDDRTTTAVVDVNWPPPIEEPRIIMEEAKMFKTLFTTQFFKPLGISLLAGTALAVAFAPAKAEEKISASALSDSGVQQRYRGRRLG